MQDHVTVDRVLKDRTNTDETELCSIKHWLLSSKIKINKLQGNRGDMRKIHVTWPFFEVSGRHGDFFEKKPVLR